MLVVGAARVFVLCHQQKQRNSSVLKMEFCKARFEAGEKAGALSRDSNDRESLGIVAAGAEGSAAQHLYGEGGRETRTKGAGCFLNFELETPLWKSQLFRKRVA